MTGMNAQHPAPTRWAHFLLRVFAGSLLAQHGVQKVFGALGGMGGTGLAGSHGLSLVGIAGPVEFIGGLLIILGLFTRPVAFVLAAEMAAVYFLMHFPHGFWPVLNRGELPALLCFVFLYLAATGAGAISLDHLLNRNRPSSIMQ